MHVPNGMEQHWAAGVRRPVEDGLKVQVHKEPAEVRKKAVEDMRADLEIPAADSLKAGNTGQQERLAGRLHSSLPDFAPQAEQMSW